jgi:hypothetical protein
MLEDCLREPTIEVFTKSIITMMIDYELTMFDALLWDFEGFGYETEKLNQVHGALGLEKYFRSYLLKNGIDDRPNIDFYADIFMGRSANLCVKNL